MAQEVKTPEHAQKRQQSKSAPSTINNHITVAGDNHMTFNTTGGMQAQQVSQNSPNYSHSHARSAQPQEGAVAPQATMQSMSTISASTRPPFPTSASVSQIHTMSGTMTSLINGANVFDSSMSPVTHSSKFLQELNLRANSVDAASASKSYQFSQGPGKTRHLRKVPNDAPERRKLALRSRTGSNINTPDKSSSLGTNYFYKTNVGDTPFEQQLRDLASRQYCNQSDPRCYQQTSDSNNLSVVMEGSHETSPTVELKDVSANTDSKFDALKSDMNDSAQGAAPTGFANVGPSGPAGETDPTLLSHASTIADTQLSSSAAAAAMTALQSEGLPQTDRNELQTVGHNLGMPPARSDTAPQQLSVSDGVAESSFGPVDARKSQISDKIAKCENDVSETQENDAKIINEQQDDLNNKNGARAKNTPPLEKLQKDVKNKVEDVLSAPLTLQQLPSNISAESNLNNLEQQYRMKIQYEFSQDSRVMLKLVQQLIKLEPDSVETAQAAQQIVQNLLEAHKKVLLELPEMHTLYQKFRRAQVTQATQDSASLAEQCDTLNKDKKRLASAQQVLKKAQLEQLQKQAECNKLLQQRIQFESQVKVLQEQETSLRNKIQHLQQQSQQTETLFANAKKKFNKSMKSHEEKLQQKLQETEKQLKEYAQGLKLLKDPESLGKLRNLLVKARQNDATGTHFKNLHTRLDEIEHKNVTDIKRIILDNEQLANRLKQHFSRYAAKPEELLEEIQSLNNYYKSYDKQLEQLQNVIQGHRTQIEDAFQAWTDTTDLNKELSNLNFDLCLQLMQHTAAAQHTLFVHQIWMATWMSFPRSNLAGVIATTPVQKLVLAIVIKHGFYACDGLATNSFALLCASESATPEGRIPFCRSPVMTIEYIHLLKVAEYAFPRHPDDSLSKIKSDLAKDTPVRGPPLWNMLKRVMQTESSQHKWEFAASALTKLIHDNCTPILKAVLAEMYEVFRPFAPPVEQAPPRTRGRSLSTRSVYSNETSGRGMSAESQSSDLPATSEYKTDFEAESMECTHLHVSDEKKRQMEPIFAQVVKKVTENPEYQQRFINDIFPGIFAYVSQFAAKNMMHKVWGQIDSQNVNSVADKCEILQLWKYMDVTQDASKTIGAIEKALNGSHLRPDMLQDQIYELNMPTFRDNDFQEVLARMFDMQQNLVPSSDEHLRELKGMNAQLLHLLPSTKDRFLTHVGTEVLDMLNTDFDKISRAHPESSSRVFANDNDDLYQFYNGTRVAVPSSEDMAAAKQLARDTQLSLSDYLVFHPPTVEITRPEQVATGLQILLPAPPKIIDCRFESNFAFPKEPQTKVSHIINLNRIMECYRLQVSCTALFGHGLFPQYAQNSANKFFVAQSSQLQFVVKSDYFYNAFLKSLNDSEPGRYLDLNQNGEQIVSHAPWYQYSDLKDKNSYLYALNNILTIGTNSEQKSILLTLTEDEVKYILETNIKATKILFNLKAPKSMQKFEKIDNITAQAIAYLEAFQSNREYYYKSTKALLDRTDIGQTQFAHTLISNIVSGESIATSICNIIRARRWTGLLSVPVQDRVCDLYIRVYITLLLHIVTSHLQYLLQTLIDNKPSKLQNWKNSLVRILADWDPLKWPELQVIQLLTPQLLFLQAILQTLMPPTWTWMPLATTPPAELIIRNPTPKLTDSLPQTLNQVQTQTQNLTAPVEPVVPLFENLAPKLVHSPLTSQPDQSRSPPLPPTKTIPPPMPQKLQNQENQVTQPSHFVFLSPLTDQSESAEQYRIMGTDTLWDTCLESKISRRDPQSLSCPRVSHPHQSSRNHSLPEQRVEPFQQEPMLNAKDAKEDVHTMSLGANKSNQEQVQHPAASQMIQSNPVTRHVAANKNDLPPRRQTSPPTASPRSQDSPLRAETPLLLQEVRAKEMMDGNSLHTTPLRNLDSRLNSAAPTESTMCHTAPTSPSFTFPAHAKSPHPSSRSTSPQLQETPNSSTTLNHAHNLRSPLQLDNMLINQTAPSLDVPRTLTAPVPVPQVPSTRLEQIRQHTMNPTVTFLSSTNLITSRSTDAPCLLPLKPPLMSYNNGSETTNIFRAALRLKSPPLQEEKQISPPNTSSIQIIMDSSCDQDTRCTIYQELPQSMTILTTPPSPATGPSTIMRLKTSSASAPVTDESRCIPTDLSANLSKRLPKTEVSVASLTQLPGNSLSPIASSVKATIKPGNRMESMNTLQFVQCSGETSMILKSQDSTVIPLPTEVAATGSTFQKAQQQKSQSQLNIGSVTNMKCSDTGYLQQNGSASLKTTSALTLLTCQAKDCAQQTPGEESLVNGLMVKYKQMACDHTIPGNLNKIRNKTNKMLINSEQAETTLFPDLSDATDSMGKMDNITLMARKEEMDQMGTLRENDTLRIMDKMGVFTDNTDNLDIIRMRHKMDQMVLSLEMDKMDASMVPMVQMATTTSMAATAPLTDSLVRNPVGQLISPMNMILNNPSDTNVLGFQKMKSQLFPALSPSTRLLLTQQLALATPGTPRHGKQSNSNNLNQPNPQQMIMKNSNCGKSTNSKKWNKRRKKNWRNCSSNVNKLSGPHEKITSSAQDPHEYPHKGPRRQLQRVHQQPLQTLVTQTAQVECPPIHHGAAIQRSIGRQEEQCKQQSVATQPAIGRQEEHWTQQMDLMDKTAKRTNSSNHHNASRQMTPLAATSQEAQMEENLIKMDEDDLGMIEKGKIGVNINKAADMGTDEMEEMNETVCTSIYSFFFSKYFFFTSVCFLVFLVCFYPSGWENWKWWKMRNMKVENSLNVLKEILNSRDLCENCEFFIYFVLFLLICAVFTRKFSYLLMFVRILFFACVFGLLSILNALFMCYLLNEMNESWDEKRKVGKLTKIFVCVCLFAYNTYGIILLSKKGFESLRKVLRKFCCLFVYFGKYTLIDFLCVCVPFERLYTRIALFKKWPCKICETTRELQLCPFGINLFCLPLVVRHNFLIIRTSVPIRLLLLFLVIFMFYTLCLDLLLFKGQNRSIFMLEHLYQNSQIFLFLNCVYTLTSFLILFYFLPSLSRNVPEHQVNVLQLNDLSTEFDTGMVFITEPIRIGNKIKTFKCLADTGASVSVINHRYAARYFKNLIAACSPLKVTVPNGDKTILQTCVPITFIDEASLKPIWTEKFFILPKLTQDVIASKHLLKRLGYELTKVSKKFSHPSAQDETFGSFCNWHDPKFKTNITSQVAAIAPPDCKSTPYAQHQLLKTGAYLKNVILSPSSVPQTAILNHISNFRATRKEIEAARNTPPDKIFQRVDLEHLKNRPWLYKRMRYLCYEKFKHVWARHSFSLSTIKGFEYSFKIKDSLKTLVSTVRNIILTLRNVLLSSSTRFVILLMDCLNQHPIRFTMYQFWSLIKVVVYAQHSIYDC